MITRENGAVSFGFDAKSLKGVVTLKRGGETWSFDLLAARGVACGPPTPCKAEWPWVRRCPALKGLSPLRPGDVTATGPTERGVALEFDREGARFRAVIEIAPAEAELSFTLEPLSSGPTALLAAELPGPLSPPPGTPVRVLASCWKQGRLYRPFKPGLPDEDLLDEEKMRWRGWGVLGERSGYLAMIEENADAEIALRKDSSGNLSTSPRWKPSWGTLAYPRRVTYAFEEQPTHTSLMKRFRRYAQARGLWKSLAEKMEARPIMRDLIGATFVFAGHCDYGARQLEGLRLLRRAGLARFFVFPTYYNVTHRRVFPDGETRVDLRPQSAEIKELGGITCSWVYLEGLDTDDMPELEPSLCRNADGTSFGNWPLSATRKWHHACRLRCIENLIAREKDLRGAQAHHFDTTAAMGLQECHDPAHPHDCRADRAGRIREFDWMIRNGYIVSSESFKDWAGPYLDVCSVKERPVWGADAPYWVVPLHHLVYHDAVVSVWHEAQPYDGEGGDPLNQSLIDLLYADPALIFPVGRAHAMRSNPTRYDILDYDAGREIAQQAIRRAVQVAEQFARLGLDEMLEHRFLTPDGAVQETVFKSGARTVVNFGSAPYRAHGKIEIEPKSWRVF